MLGQKPVGPTLLIHHSICVLRVDIVMRQVPRGKYDGALIPRNFIMSAIAFRAQADITPNKRYPHSRLMQVSLPLLCIILYYIVLYCIGVE